MPALPRRKLTYEDFEKIPDDGKRHEILDGVHFVSPTPYVRHQFVLGELALQVHGFVRHHRHLGKVFLGPLDIVLSRHDIAAPDLLFIADSRSGIVAEKNVQGAPDLVVEIVSRDTRWRDFGLKRDRYELLGVGEYWVVDPDRDTMTVFHREGDLFVEPVRFSAAADDCVTTPLLPGLEIPMRDLFAR
jgi:Uma2 family endonuclease